MFGEMARKLRIEFEGAIYHVLNRGNYRRDLFTNAGEAQAFVGALQEAVKIHGWRLHAYAVMRNHYHLALQTPQPNLKDGMHWLQSTFATRFNRLHGERGHLFQGRYQALLVENDASLGRLVNYIHLNPVRAGIVPPEQVASFRWSSLRAFVGGERFAGLEAVDWLRAAGLADDAEGWAAYVQRLRKPGQRGRAENCKIRPLKRLRRVKILADSAARLAPALRRACELSRALLAPSLALGLLECNPARPGPRRRNAP